MTPNKTIKKMYNIYCADLETTTNPDIEPEVWFCGYKYLYDTNYPLFFTNIYDMFYSWLSLDNPLIYFHYGGKFDTRFIFDMLFKLGYYPTDNIREIEIKNRKHFKFFASKGIVYSIEIYTQKHKILIYDSYRLIPLSIETLGGKTKGKFKGKEYYDIKYNNINEIPDFEKEKLNEDINTMAIHLQADLFYGKTNCKKEKLAMTIGSLGVNIQKNISPAINNKLNNKLTLEQWDYYHNFLKGGLVYCNPKYLNKKIYGNIYHYDINSMYPSILTGDIPEGPPLNYEPKLSNYVTCYEIYIKSAILKKDKLPYLGKVNEEGVYEYVPYIFNSAEYIFDFELELIQEHYKIEYNIIKKSYFLTSKYMEKFINYAYTKRIEFKEKNDKINDNAYKLLMNSGAFGKRCQSRHVDKNYFQELTEAQLSSLHKNSKYYIAENGKYYFFTSKKISETKERDLSYIILGSYVTAKGRVIITKLRQMYEKNFIYGDTDDLYLLEKQVDNKWLSNTKLGMLKYDPQKDFGNKFYCHASKKYWFKDFIKFAGFRISENICISFEEFCNLKELPDGKNHIKNINGKPVITKTLGILRKDNTTYLNKWQLYINNDTA